MTETESKGNLAHNKEFMKMFKETVCMITMCLISILWKAGSTKGDKVCTPLTRMRGPHPQGICGHRIDEMLDILCPFGTNELIKRDPENAEESKQNLNKMLFNKEEANSYIAKRDEFHQTGIVCECCIHACSLSELMSYCRGPMFK